MKRFQNKQTYQVKPIFRRQHEEAPRLGRTAELAFTLTELLVIIGILLLLGVTLATALANTRPNSLTFRCLNNLRQLGLGWRMYSEDYQGGLVYNHEGTAAGKDG